MTDAAPNTAEFAAQGTPSASAQPASVGTQLRMAREAAQLSIDEIAGTLKFSPRQIEALEADHYAALPGATIVRGFVRSYARLLGLDTDALLRQLEPVLPSGPAEVRPPENMGVASQPRGMRELSPLVTIAIVLLLAAVLLVLWHFFGPAPSQVQSATSLSGQAAPQPQTSQAADGPVAASQPSGAAPVEGVMPPPAAQPQDAAAPTLRFAFADRSWVEVTDANRQLLHSGENPGGSQLTLTGKPPFDIVIGNAGKVTLSYGERNIDLAPFMRAEVARLTLE